MYGDFSRDVSLAPQGYRRVLMQQGRVLLDADYNDQVAIILDNQDTLIKTFLANYSTVDAGFQVKVPSGRQGPPTMTLAAGHYFVGGLLCARERCAEPPAFPAEVKDMRFLVYLEAWEQALAAVEDTRGDFREPALDGVDTTLRTEVRCRVLLDPIKDTEFGDIPAPNAAARRSEIEQIANVDPIKPPTLPQLPKPFGVSQSFRWLTAVAGVLALIALLIALVSGREPGLLPITLALVGALIFAAILLDILHEMPATIVKTYDEQREKTDEFYRNVVASYDELIDSYRTLVAKAARELTEPLRQREVTKIFQEQFEAYRGRVHGEGDAAATATLKVQYVGRGGQGTKKYGGSRSLLYRVEVHHVDDAGQVWIKWSRDNGAHLFKVEPPRQNGQQPPAPPAETASLTIEARQAESDELIDRWVELLPADLADNGRPLLRRVDEAIWDYTRRTATLTLDGPAAVPAFVRAWDHQPGEAVADRASPSYGAIRVGAAWLPLEDGLEIRLGGAGAGYRPGDHWLIRARPGKMLGKQDDTPAPAASDPNQEQESELDVQRRRLHYAPLALVAFDGDGKATVTDCRILVPPAGRLTDATIEVLSPLPRQ